MQNNGLDVELQRTLNELCTDLFITSALDDCSAILQSLALLAETFPQAQSLLGRLLSRFDDSPKHPRTVSKLSALSTEFLYNNETAHSGVCLLAALANDNVRNQRRIVQNVTGVKLDFDPSKYEPWSSTRATEKHLYALTIPVIVTNTYRRWRKRQRELQNRRIPSGVPPAHEGIPMPCHCDECLGADQFLSTWQQHFHDLSRWALDPDKETSSTSSPRSTLSANEFLRMFLEDYQLRVCTVGEALNNQMPSIHQGNKHPSRVYYFVSPEEVAAATPRTPVQFNPLHHVSAIAIAAGIDIETARQAHRELLLSGTVPNVSQRIEVADSTTFPTNQVILFTGTTDVGSCIAVSREYRENSDAVENWQSLNANIHDRILADFHRFEECGLLVRDVNEDIDIMETTRQLLLNMVEFCESDDQIPLNALQHSFSSSEEDGTHPKIIRSPPLNVNITMTVVLNEQVLQISCFPSDSESSIPHSFSTTIPQKELLGVSNMGDLSLLCLSDEALEILLQRCRICTCDNQENHSDAGAVFYLLPFTSNQEESVSSTENNDVDDKTTPESCGLQHRDVIRSPLAGLSFEAKRKLVTLEAVVAEEKYRKLTCKDLETAMKTIAKVVADCNEQIFYLSAARDKELIRATTEIHRTAAISRCRHCRDQLIQLGKKLSLMVKSLDPLAPLSQEKLSRVAKLVRSSIHDVLTHSETFDPWETPDARVAKLHLNRRIWASGFPDAAYYQDTDTRRRENRKQQQQLSQKLLQQKKKQSKHEARIKQRRENN